MVDDDSDCVEKTEKLAERKGKMVLKVRLDLLLVVEGRW